MNDIEELKARANEIRCDIIKMICEAGSGHPGGALSATDLMVALYFKQLRHKPNNPNWPERDRVVFSKGHSSALLYACLAMAGYFPKKELMSFQVWLKASGASITR